MGLFGKKDEDKSVLKKYSVLYLGGHQENPKKTYNVNFVVKQDCFEVNSTVDKKFIPFTIDYCHVKAFDIVQRQVGTFEGIVGGLDSKQLNQSNNINITYENEHNAELTIRLEMITGVTVMAQAVKCSELVDFLKINHIYDKFSKGEASNCVGNTESPIELLKKLSDLKEQGIISDEEFITKKTEILSRM